MDWHVYVSTAISRSGGSRSGRIQQTIIHNLSLEKYNFISILLRESEDSPIFNTPLLLYHSPILDIPASPLSKTNPLIDICNTSLSDTLLTQTKDSNPSKTLKKCPCGQSSGGHSWLLKCTSCTQTWHSDCANLKGKLPKSTIDSLDTWQCPWWGGGANDYQWRLLGTNGD